MVIRPIDQRDVNPRNASQSFCKIQSREAATDTPQDDLHWALRPKLPALAVAVWIVSVAGSVSALVMFALVTGH